LDSAGIGRCGLYRQTVAGVENTWRVMGFDWVTPFTV
jgi:hypothetical protein